MENRDRALDRVFGNQAKVTAVINKESIACKTFVGSSVHEDSNIPDDDFLRDLVEKFYSSISRVSQKKRHRNRK